MDDRPAIDRLAESIADGATVDWAAAESSARTEYERQVIARLRRIGELTGHGRQPAGDPAPPAGKAVTEATGADRARQWGHLSILERVGEGAFGEVYRARDPKLARDVALKLLRESSSTNGAGAEVIEEGRLLARIRHPNVATVYGADRLDGYVGIWMEFIHGRTLEQVLGEHGPFGAGEAAQIGIDLCRALGAVHQAGLVHRDLKTQNVMREDDGGRLVLMDFGTGREREQRHDSLTSLSGTPLYVAPEVFDGEPATVRSDIYSLGVLLYRLVTNSYPVTARTLGELVAAHKAHARTPLAEVRPHLPPGFIDVVDRATAPDAQFRYANAQDLEAALAGAVRAPVPAEPVVQPTARSGRLRQWLTESPALASAAVIAVTILIALSAWLSGVWPAQPAPTGPRALVLVADFDDTTDVPNLGQSVKAWLEQELRNSRVVDIVPAVRIDDVLKLMRRQSDERITSLLASRICERDGGIQLYITGAAGPVGPGYILTASLFTPSGQNLGSAREAAASQSQLMPSIQRLAARIRELAGESRAEITQANQDAFRVTTSSLEAYRLYRAAYTRRDGQDWKKSLSLIEQALEIDPEFPSAHIWRAWGLWHMYKDFDLDTRADAVAAAKHAMELRNTVAAPWERFWIEGSYGSITGDLEQATGSYKALLDLYPTHDWAVGNLSNVTGRLNRPFEAVPYAARAADLRPYDRLAVEEAALATLEAGDVARARQDMERLRAIRSNRAADISAAEVGIVEAWAAWQRGEAKEARRLLDQVMPVLNVSGWTNRGGGGVRGSVTRLYLALGRPTDAKKAATGRFSKSLVSYVQEDSEMLRRNLPAKLSFDKPTADQMTPEEWTIMLLQAGNLNEANRRVDFALRQAPPSGGPSFLTVLQARLLRSRGNDAGALTLLLTTPPTAEASPLYLLDRADILADLLIKQGKTKDALEALRAARWNPATSNTYTPLLGLKNLARQLDLERRFGDPAESDRIVAELQKLLAEAEPDFPLAKKLRVTGHGG